jgi:hypothetical protein
MSHVNKAYSLFSFFSLNREQLMGIETLKNLKCSPLISPLNVTLITTVLIKQIENNWQYQKQSQEKTINLSTNTSITTVET